VGGGSIISSNLSIPCLHRIHQGNPARTHVTSYKIGMSLELCELMRRLDELNSISTRKGVEDRSILVTFDDGWSDVTLLADFFDDNRKLQPVLFLTNEHIKGNRSLLPLSRLYAWCDSWLLDIDQIEDLGISRECLKSLPESLQHSILDDLNIPNTHLSSQILDCEQIGYLKKKGWIIASHAHDHHDLRFDKDEDLLEGLILARKGIEEFGGEPWLAWPEGRCTIRTCEIAKKAGFEKQFSLDVEAGNVDHPDLISRTIWS